MVALAEERNDGDTRVTTDNSNILVFRVSALDLADEAAGADDIEGGDTEEALGVVDAMGLEDLGDDRNGGVNGVGDDEKIGLRAGFGAGLSKVTNDRGVGVEKIVTGHTGLAGDTGGDQDDITTLEGVGQARSSGFITLDSALGVDVRDIGGDTYKTTVALIMNRQDLELYVSDLRSKSRMSRK